MSSLTNAVGQVEQASCGALEARLDGTVLEATLNRPDKLNAINSQVLAGLEVVSSLCEDAAVRALLLTARGSAFSAGGDLGEVRGLVSSDVAFSAFLDRWHHALFGIERVPVPVVAAAHGYALAGGLELLQVCDVVVLGDQTVVGDQHATFGLMPAGGSTQRLPRQIGDRMARWLLLSGSSLDADQAVAVGLATFVVPESEVRAKGLAIARDLSRRSREASAAIKEALAIGRHRPLSEALSLERPIAVRHMTGKDARLGLAAFAQRKRPNFENGGMDA